jgi:hypothetical protein
MKRCLRCRRELPIGDYAWEGRAYHCDDCRWEGLSEQDKKAAQLLSKRAWRQRNLDRVQAYDRDRYYRQRAA